MKHSAQAAKPKQLRAIQASRHLHVVAPKHTGRLLPRHTTSYPVLAMLVLCTGVFLASWTRFVTADSGTGDYTVMASVPGPPPSVAATIDSPADGTIFTSLPVTISGSCPVNTFESLYRNSVFSGVALCSAEGGYSIQTGLTAGSNVMQVRDFSSTDVGGPMSNSVTLIYNPPTPPPVITTGGSGNTLAISPAPPGVSQYTQATSGSPTEVSTSPLLFKTSFNYEGYYVNQLTTWTLDIEGGSPPYAISVNWGDGSKDSLVSRSSPGLFQVTHTYSKAGGYKGSIVNDFVATDSAGNQTYMQLLAIINNPPTAAPTSHALTSGLSLGNTSNPTSSYITHLLHYIWPSYAFVVLLLLSFWLGERREFHHLRPARRARSH